MDITFIYDKPAALIGAGKSRTLAVGDIHIGIERRLAKSGIRLHGQTERIAKSISGLADRFKVRRIAILGDIKESLLYPDNGERIALQRFFYLLKDYKLVLLRGNHDAHLGEVMRLELLDEFLFGRFALLHGNSWPSDDAIEKDYIITAHNHVAVSFYDENKGFYKEKAWLLSDINGRRAAKHYRSFNRHAKLLMMPAFNDLILGSELSRLHGDNINPLIKNNIFEYKKGTAYTLKGDIVTAAGAPYNREIKYKE